MYEPLFNLDCIQCDRTPVVCLEDDEGALRCTQLCGVCFFGNRMMADWDLWNTTQEDTE
jgi:hypothetical protein